MAIVDILQKKGALTDSELLDELAKMYGEVDKSALNKALIKLEIGGLVQVSEMAKKGFRIELLQRE